MNILYFEFSFSTLQPVLGGVLGAIILGERISAQHAVGGLIMCASVALIIYAREVEKRAQAQLEAAIPAPSIELKSAPEEAIGTTLPPHVLHVRANDVRVRTRAPRPAGDVERAPAATYASGGTALHVSEELFMDADGAVHIVCVQTAR